MSERKTSFSFFRDRPTNETVIYHPHTNSKTTLTCACSLYVFSAAYSATTGPTYESVGERFTVRKKGRLKKETKKERRGRWIDR